MHQSLLLFSNFLSKFSAREREDDEAEEEGQGDLMSIESRITDQQTSGHKGKKKKERVPREGVANELTIFDNHYLP